MEAIDAVVKPLVDSAIGATEKAATVGLDAIGGVVLFIFASSQEAGSSKELEAEKRAEEKFEKDQAEPQAASGGQGVRGGKKDRSGQGNVDQLEGLEHAQQQTNKSSKGQYGLKTDKSKQNIDNANKRIKSLEDSVE
jgi:hypothetical protein